MSDLQQYRASSAEQERSSDLLRLIPSRGSIALDIGARDGYYSKLLAERFEQVIALDLALPKVVHPRVTCVAGDATRLAMADASVDFVLCAEVLEHIPGDGLRAACAEIERVCKGRALIGVPFRQDLRVGRTTCCHCGGRNPPWGHVNSFDQNRLKSLFPTSDVLETSFVGSHCEVTNPIAAALMDLAGNPYGTYEQDEACIHCGGPLAPPPPRSLVQKVLTRLAVLARGSTTLVARPTPRWIHVLLGRTS